MTIQEASERYMIPIKILKEYESWGLCGAVRSFCSKNDLRWKRSQDAEWAAGTGSGGEAMGNPAGLNVIRFWEKEMK